MLLLTRDTWGSAGIAADVAGQIKENISSCILQLIESILLILA